jgi:hypothetical protein
MLQFYFYVVVLFLGIISFTFLSFTDELITIKPLTSIDDPEEEDLECEPESVAEGGEDDKVPEGTTERVRYIVLLQDTYRHS